MARRSHVTICSETVGYVCILSVIIIGAMMREINLLIILSGMMLGPLFFSWQLVRATLRRLEVQRLSPRTTSPDELLVVDVTVTNPRRRMGAWALVVEDELHRIDRDGVSTRQAAAPARMFVPAVGAEQSVRTSYRGRLVERGRYRFGPLRLSTRIPLGLLKGTVTINHFTEILVYPRLGTLLAGWNEVVRQDQLGQRSRHRRQGPREGEFYGLRDWRTGDSRRWIHWRSSAKRGKLLVRQYEQTRSQDFIIVLDLWPGPAEKGSTTGDGDRQLAELAISFVATVVSDHCRRGSGKLILGVAGNSRRAVRGPASTALLMEAMEVLADAQPAELDQLPATLDQVITKVAVGQRIIIVSTRPTDTHDTSRFQDIWNDTQRRTMLSRAICIDVSGDDFQHTFVCDPSEASDPMRAGLTLAESS